MVSCFHPPGHKTSKSITLQQEGDDEYQGGQDLLQESCQGGPFRPLFGRVAPATTSDAAYTL